MKLPLVTVAGLLAFTACGDSNPSDLDPSWPDVEQYYRVESNGPVCNSAASQALSDDGQQYTCTWKRVVVDGQPRCLAIVVFSKDEGGQWGYPPAVFVTHATICD